MKKKEKELIRNQIDKFWWEHHENVLRKSQQPSKHLLKARDVVKHFSSLSLSLNSTDKLHLSPDHAIRTSALASFMCVVVESEKSSSPEEEEGLGVELLSVFIERGMEDSIILIENCVHHFKIFEKNLKITQLEPAFSAIFRRLMGKPYFCKVFSCLRKHTDINETFLDNLSTSLQLSPYEKFQFTVALANADDDDLSRAGQNYCEEQFKELCELSERGHIPSVRALIEERVRSLMEGECSIQEPSDRAHQSGTQDLIQEAAPTSPKALQEDTALLSSNDQLSKEMESLCITSTDDCPMKENIGDDPDSSTVEVDADDINTEANAYFQQMFSGQLTVDAMVQMLTQFKGSSEKREQLVFEYMISNLLQVKKFFNTYSDEHFNLSAILFGLLIKHQVVSDSTLSIALQSVLDALHEPADSKIFIFGTKALEAFVDRLIEFPEFCQQVLQISHLQGTHSELVSIIEQTLGRTSSSHSESDEAHNQCSSIPPPENVVEPVRSLKEGECGIQEPSDSAHKSGTQDLIQEAAPTSPKALQEDTALLSSNDQLSKEMESLCITSTDDCPMIENISDDPDSSTVEVDEDHITTEANAYFQQMFSGQLTVDAMVQMLMQFKGSSEKSFFANPSYYALWLPDHTLEQLIFEYMISNLLQVKTFSNTCSNEQFNLSAVLYGLLIKNQVVSDSTLSIALQSILDALQEPADSKIFIFGTKALETFVDRLIDLPEFYQQVLQISHLQGTHSELVPIMEQTLGRTSSSHSESDEAQSQCSSIPPPENVVMPDSSSPLTGSDGEHLGSQISSPPKLQQRNEIQSDEIQKPSLTESSHTNQNLTTSFATSSDSASIQKPQSVARSSALMASSPEFHPPPRTVASARFVSASVRTLFDAAQRRETPIQAPPSQKRDKISFIFNTLSTANIEAKVEEFTEILEEQYYPWFAQYLVMKRASKEPNFHKLYMNFLEKAHSKQLMEEVVQETYENLIFYLGMQQVLLRSELIQTSSEERLLLKNLGGWLGIITIGRNRVLLSKHIDPKSLIIEAYEKGLMIGIIPFTSKVLEPCKGSLAYQPPNPWTMGILGLLAEIHAMPNLKANLKFSIEILFKNLELDMKAVTPTSLLKDRVRKIEGNPDFCNKDVGSSQQNTVTSAVNQSELPHEAAVTSYQGGDSHILYQHAAPVHFPAVPFVEDMNMLFQRLLPVVMDKAIKEILSNIVQKSITIATQTTMALVLKEYDNEFDENYIHSTSSSIIVCLAGNLSYVNSKEPLRKKMSSQLRNSLQGLNIASESLEHAMQRVIDDNLELGCASIEKAAIETGLVIVKNEIAQQLSVRRKQRESSRITTIDPNLYAQSIGTFPEAFHPQAAQFVSLHQQQVRMVPAPQSHVSWTYNVANEMRAQQQMFLPPSSSRHFISKPSLTTGAALDEYHVLAKKLDFLIGKEAKQAEIQSVICEVPVVVLRCINKDEAALALAQTVFESLYENAANYVHVIADLDILAGVCDVSKLVRRELTSWVMHSDDERRFNKDITVGLIRRELLNLTEYDAYMAKLIDGGKSGATIEFFISLVETLKLSDAGVLSSLHNVVHTLSKVTKHPVASKDDDDAFISSEPDPPSFHWQVSGIFNDWCRIRDRHGVNDAARAHFVLELHQNVLSRADDMPNRFFRRLMELGVSHYLSSQGANEEASLSSFLVIDIYADLVFSILRSLPVDQGSSKLSLFSKVLAVIVRFVKKDAEEKKESFISTPYFRLFINFFNHLHTLNSSVNDENFQMYAALSNSFHALQPLKVPAFSFPWVELISHKDFMPKLFAANGQKGWPYFKGLLLDLLMFMEPFLRTGELTDPVRILYKGTLRVLLVVVHDFPDFVCYYNFSFCEAIASRCVQLRNIILSTFPANMSLPDPNTPNLKVDLLAEISQPPCIDPEFAAALKANNMKNDIDEYFMTRPETSSFLYGLKYRLLLSSREAERSGTYYNVPLINSLVLYVGTKAIQQLQVSTASHATSITRFVSKTGYFAGAALDIFRTLIRDLNWEGRYLFFNAVADQLRYPNNHTHFFSFILLQFFVEIKEEAIQEQITRVLLERLITKLPHPWGVQVTFIELVKNPRYKFWNLNFTRSDPEIKRVFDFVSTSFGVHVQAVNVVSGVL
ncbi:uncharacterized protein LOC111896007 [Lactuca sativa]|uniref:uncharacterized protein LOC111896007 n=1 Tax=Lactuca sativa TaxID=4236 RepID=UPI0022AE98C9|nr:uncharacterized protein LOC111896007 [Lactuca sativa]